MTPMRAKQLQSALRDGNPGQSADVPRTISQQEPLAIIERLKEEFGDYTDPLTYDWTWRETD